MLTSSTLPTVLNINTWPTSSSTATSHTKTSLTSGNTLMSSGMKPPSNTISSNTMKFHSLTSTPKPPEHPRRPFPNYPGFFAQGVRITHNQQHDQGEFARIIHNTWQLHKNTHSLIVALLAWGAATKYTSGGEEQAMTRLRDHHGAVFHQKGRCWVIHPNHAIVKGLAWSINSTPPDL